MPDDDEVLPQDIVIDGRKGRYNDAPDEGKSRDVARGSSWSSA
jgi:hypothetical protein